MLFAMSFFIKYVWGNLFPDVINKVYYRLSTANIKKPTFCEIRFILDTEIYRYGFEADYQKVHSEWLFVKPNQLHGTERKMFSREFDEYDINSVNFKNAKGLKEKTKSDRLFLNIAFEFNQPVAVSIMNWLEDFTPNPDIDYDNLFELSCELYSDPDIKKYAVDFLSQFNLGFENFDVNQANQYNFEREELIDSSDILSSDRNSSLDENSEIVTYHNVYDLDGNIVGVDKLDLGDDESLGTHKIFAFSSMLISKLINGGVLIVDELDASLHPLLTQKIIELFHSPINDKNAQLIFSTHDTNLLSSEFFRRDQIWFTEKDEYGATDLYSLVEIKETRKDASFAKNYINGKYGAIPFIGDFYGLGQES
ncbi:MAG: ATP-binding protein [Chlorobi bacterium]|nr:ATP-binding protein [Chlorobiota bacterium]